MYGYVWCVRALWNAADVRALCGLRGGARIGHARRAKGHSQMAHAGWERCARATCPVLKGERSWRGCALGEPCMHMFSFVVAHMLRAKHRGCGNTANGQRS
eukprot:6589179-Prymnesium_polylepis.1